jgi:hypothetical protein
MGRSREVDAWLAKYDNPMKAVVQRIRTIVLDADARMDECIKWRAHVHVPRQPRQLLSEEPAAREPDVPPGRAHSGHARAARGVG